MKSTPKCDHGRVGTGSGRSLPDGRWQGLLEMAQSEHPCMNLLTVSGHVEPPEVNLLAARGFHWPRGGQCPEMNVPSE